MRLGETFDAVLVHDAISYMTTEADLLASLRDGARPPPPRRSADRRARRLHRHVRSAPASTTRPTATPNTELTYVEYSTDLDPKDTTIETTYVFFIKRGTNLRVEVDNHTTGLFPIATWQRLLTEGGFEVDRVDYPVSKDGRVMWLWLGGG